MDQTKLVVGLGNPGSKYVDTRHNMGFMVVDRLSEVSGIEVNQKKFGARFGVGEFAGQRLILLKPWQYMNLSGRVVATVVGFYRLDLSDVLVVTDDMALEPGRVRIRAKGSAGGHNGLSDIIARLGTDAFARLRVGIGQCVGRDAADYVLARPDSEQAVLLKEALGRVGDAAVCWIEHGIDRTMNQFNAEAPNGLDDKTE